MFPLNDKPYIVDTVDALATVPSTYTTAIVRDALRGDVFNWSATGTANGGTVYAGTTGYWVRDFDYVSVSPDWWGAKPDNLIASSATNTTAIQAALATGYIVKFSKGVYYHNGILIDMDNLSGRVLIGAGQLLTTLKCNVAGVNNITVTRSVAESYRFLRIKDLGLDSNQSNGSGISLVGVSFFALEDLHIIQQGSHGISMVGGALAESGSWIGSITNVRCASNIGDGLYIVATNGTKQENVIHVYGGEYKNNANGITIWGHSISIRDSTIEGNVGKGIRVQNFITAGPIYSAKNISITGNYFELNATGSIYVKTDAVNSGIISGLTIEDNNLLSSTADVGYKDILFVGASSNDVRGLSFSNNNFSFTGVDPTVYADFGGYLGYDCVVKPSYSLTTLSDSTVIPAIAAKYINLGRSKFDFIRTITMHGLWDSKGATGITYSNTVKSDSITVSGSNTFFPISVPFGSTIVKIGIPVETDSTSYSVTPSIKNRAYNTTGAYVSKTNTAIVGSGTTTIETMTIFKYAANDRMVLSELDLLLQITVTLTVPGTFFYMGNPTIYYL